MSAQELEGGDLNVVVRVGDTVRSPTARWSHAVHALLPGERATDVGALASWSAPLSLAFGSLLRLHQPRSGR